MANQSTATSAAKFVVFAFGGAATALLTGTSVYEAMEEQRLASPGGDARSIPQGDSEPCADELAALASLDDDWNGKGAAKPSELARSLATHVVERIHASERAVERIAADASGGVSIYIRGSRAGRYAGITVDNDGDMIAFRSDRTPAGAHAWDVGAGDLDRAIDELAAFRSA